MDDPPPFDMTLEQAAVVYAIAHGATMRMIEHELGDHPYGDAIPRVVLTAGQAALLVPSVLLLIRKVFPTIADPDVLLAALRDGSTPLPTIN